MMLFYRRDFPGLDGHPCVALEMSLRQLTLIPAAWEEPIDRHFLSSMACWYLYFVAIGRWHCAMVRP